MNKNVFRIFLILALIYPIIIFWIFPQWTIDDAFLAFRTVENFVEHGQLSWNIVGERVEGYTGVAMPIMLAGLYKLGAPLIESARWVGILSYFLSWLFLFLILRRLKVDNFIIALVLLLFATTPVLFTHATSGLETMLFMASVLLGMYVFLMSLGEVNRPHSHWNTFFLFLTLLFVSLVRPEGVAFAGFIILSALYVIYRHRRSELPPFLLYFLLIYLLPALVYFLWRWNYYGVMLPNSYYVKRGNGFSLNILMDIFRFGRRFFATPFLAALVLLIPELDRIWLRAKDFWRLCFNYVFWPSALFLVVLVIFLSRSHLTTNFSTRFYMPFLPFLWIFLAYLFNLGFSTLNELKKDKPLSYKLALILFAVLCFYQIAFQVAKLKEEIVFASEEKSAKESQHYLAGEFLQKNLLPSEWLVVYLDAGAVSYFSKMKAVDFSGLTDAFLARSSPSLKEKIDYFYSKNPAAIFITSTSLDKVEYTEESEAITQDSRFANYVLTKKYPSPLSWTIKYHELLFLRKDLVAKLDNNQ